jgi:hypothetical protein
VGPRCILELYAGTYITSGVGRLDFNRSLSLLRLCRDRLARVRIEFACRSRFRGHSLHGVHDVGLLSEKHVAQIGGPANV